MTIQLRLGFVAQHGEFRQARYVRFGNGIELSDVVAATCRS